MKKKINNCQFREKLVKILEDTPNTVPRSIKETFSFKGRKSPEILEKVILSVTKEGDIILDPFFGSGMIALATKKTGRKLVGVELDNYTYNIDKCLFEKIDKDNLSDLYEQVKSQAKEKVYELYETQCCGEKNYIKKLFFDPIDGEEGYYNPLPNREFEHGENIKLEYRCKHCGKSTKKFDDIDLKKIREISERDVSEFPRNQYIVNSRINITSSTGADKFDAIFTQRNKLALLIIQKEISKLPEGKEKEFLQQVLVASLSLARIAMYGSSTDILYHVVNERAQDMNVWDLFESRYEKFLRFQDEYNFVLTDNFSNGDDYFVVNDDYQHYLDVHKDLRFDAIITDFPYTDQVPYLERNQLFRVWLNKFDDHNEKYSLTEDMLDNEIVVTDAISRKEKNLENYYRDIDKMFRMFNEHLSDHAPVVIFTKLGKKKYFNVFTKIIDLARKNGFEYTFRIGVEKNDPTLRKQSAYKNTLINEVLIGFEKLPEKDRYFYINDLNYEAKIIDEIYIELKKTKDIPYTMTAAILKIKRDLIARGVKYSELIEEKIIDVITSNFYVDDRQEIQLDKKRLYLDQEDEDTLFKKLYELVPIYIKRLLDSKGKFVIEDLYTELIDDLSDGNNKTIYSLLNNDDNIKEIDDLVLSKTDVNGKYYVKKQLPKKVDKFAIDIATMDPYEFEDLCKLLLEKEKFSDVQRKGGSGDLGVDIVAKRFNGNSSETWLIQCKRWVSNVDATPLQRLVSERERLGANKISCYTTSSFSSDAKKIAEAQNVELVDGENLIIRLNQFFPGKYYNSNFLV